MRAASGLQCPRCNASVADMQEVCAECGFRFRLSNDSLRHTARHGDSMQQAAATRDLEQKQDPLSMQGIAYLMGFFTIVLLLLGLNSLMLPDGELACANSRNFICRVAQVFGGKSYVNIAHGIIFLVFSLGTGIVACRIYRSSLNKIAEALARERTKSGS